NTLLPTVKKKKKKKKRKKALNLVFPRKLGHILPCILLLCAAENFLLAFSMPLLKHHIDRYAQVRPASHGPGIRRTHKLMKADAVSWCQQPGWTKARFYLLAFYLCMYVFIYVCMSF
uniref:Cyclin dependent kinase inhibitor 3 n=1 Tax=Sus scrofa TaxID=9823 RepID=A0A8D0NY93_PIG